MGISKLGAKEIRMIDPREARLAAKQVKRKRIFIILEDVLDTYNVGAFFRLAEAVATKKMYLCGRTDTPPNPKIIKASVGNYKLVPWAYKKTAAAAIREIKKTNKNLMVVAVEQHPSSRDYKQIDYRYPIAFIFGNENTGTKMPTLKLAEEISEVPMHGLNKSLNVMVAAGIVLYHAVEVGLPSPSDRKPGRR